MNPLTPLSSAASRPAFSSSPTAVRTAVEAQGALANRLAERLGLSAGALHGTGDDFSPEQVAGRVLGFIERRLQSEAAAGAAPDKLQGLLSQAREGVEKGFAEARKILDGLGVLRGEVAADIDATYQRIQDGLGDLAQRFNPAPATGSSALAAYGERFSALAETFELAVTTRDGDRLRISIAQASASGSQTSVAAASEGNGSAVVASSQAGSLQIGAWQIQIEGELDAGERSALEQLFGQVQELSSKFYAGDLAGAFDRAMVLELDGEQLASMSLRLTQTRVRQATDVYGAVGGQAASVVGGALSDYAQALLDALRGADALIEDGRGGLQELLEGGFALDERFDAARLDKAERLNTRLLEGLQGLRDRASLSGVPTAA
jgi:hypothetical protein